MSRLKLRNREEEGGIPDDYQRDLIQKHDELLLEPGSATADSNSGDRVIPRGGNEFGEATLIVDASRDFQHDKNRLDEIFSKMDCFLVDNGIAPHGFGKGSTMEVDATSCTSTSAAATPNVGTPGWLCTLLASESREKLCTLSTDFKFQIYSSP